MVQKSVEKKIFFTPVIVIGLIALIVTMNVFLSTRFIKYSNSLIDEKLAANINSLKLYLEDSKANSKAAAVAMSRDPKAIEAIKNRDTNEILQVFTPEQDLYRISYFTISDSEGNVLARTYDPENYGDSILNQQNIQDALAGSISTYFESGTAIKVAVRTGAPVYDTDGTLVGVISAGIRFDIDDAVEKLKEIFKSEVTVFRGYEKVATTITKDGHNIAGTSIDPDIAEIVIKNKQEYTGDTVIFGDQYKTYYSPIINADGEAFATFFLGIPLSQLRTETRISVLSGIIIGLAGILFLIILLLRNRREKHRLTIMAEKIKEEHERTKVLLDATPLACHLWNRKLEIFDCNEENVRLYKLHNTQELLDDIGAFLPEYQPNGELSSEATVKYLTKAFADGICVFKSIHKASDGTPIPVEVTLVRVAYEDDYAVAGYVRDLREYQEMMEEIEQRDILLETGHQAAEILLTTEDDTDIEVSLMESMELVGRSVDVDRVQIWQNEMINGSLHFVHKYQWLSDTGRQKTSVPIGLELPYSDKPEWERMFMRDEHINGPLSRLSQADREYLKDFDLKSIAMIPLFLQDRFWGFFSIVDCRRERIFTEDVINILRSVSLMMASAVNRSAQAVKILEAYEQSRLLLDAMPFTCNFWDKDLNVIECNEEGVRLFKVKSKRDFLKHFHELSPRYQPDGSLSFEKSLELVKKAFAEGICIFEWMHQTIDGTPIPAEVTLVRVPYDSDYAVAGYVRDLREHKQMMAEIEHRDNLLQAALDDAQKANSAKSDFLASMSHEMRTPLNAILGLSELTIDAGRLHEEDRFFLEKIYNAGETLLNTVNDILDISKIEAGRLELIPVEYDIPSVINDTVTQNLMRIGEKPIELKLDIDESIFARLFGDELRIKQIMNNLLSNAIKYTDEGTVELSIHSELSKEGSPSLEGGVVWLTIKVKDTGKGIRPEDIGKLFSDYAQIDLKSNRKIEGTGLGLPITKRLAEMMDGSIDVESEYGKGSVFTIRLKQKFLTEATIGHEVVESLKSFRYSDSRRGKNARFKRIRLPYARVLIVDDNATNLEVAKGMMKPYGMQIDCLSSGQQAVAAIHAEKARYNAVFMDHMMPGMDGIEATRLIREIGTDYAKNIPIIALTANAIAGNREMFLGKGFQSFLSKPVDMLSLDEAIKQWVRDEAQEKSLAEQGLFADGQLMPDLEQGEDRRNIFSRRSGIDRRLMQKKFAGLDIQKGIEKFNGDEETYLNVLRSYAANTRPLLESLENPGRENLAGYAITVHGIKGSSRGILAEMIGNAAEELEKAAKAGEYDLIKKNNNIFLEAAWKLIHDLEEMFSGIDAENKKPKKDKPDHDVLMKLLDSCTSYNMDGVDEAMADMEKYEYESDDGLAAWLRENVQQMNFSEITEKLSGLTE